MGADVLTPTHLIFLLLLAVLLFGSKRLPEIGRGLGKGMREFKESVSGLSEVTDAVHGVQEARKAVNPANVAAAVVPGVRDMQETVSTAKSLANPLAPPAEAAAPAEAPPAAS
jgi:sec-independent protein translocase protein TatA